MLSRQGWIEVTRRVLALTALLVAAVAGIGHGAWLVVGAALATGLAFYLLLPRPHPPPDAYLIERMPSVYMPDLLGALLATTFLALPFIAAAYDPSLGGPWGLLLLTGLPGLVSLTIFWIAARYQCHWVMVQDATLVVSSIKGVVQVPLRDITMVSREARRPPRWLAPLLALFGGAQGAGVALLHGRRAAHSLVVERRSGDALRMAADSAPWLPEFVAKLAQAGVPIHPDL